MAIAAAVQSKLVEAVRKHLGQVPWVEAVLLAPQVPALQVWTVPPPPDPASEEAIYPQELALICAFPGEHFDFHFAERSEVEDLKRAGALTALSR